MKKGQNVITNTFTDESGCIFLKEMQEFVGKPGEVTEIDKDGELAKVHEYWWPISSITIVLPKNVPIADYLELVDALNEISKMYESTNPHPAPSLAIKALSTVDQLLIK